MVKPLPIARGLAHNGSRNINVAPCIFGMPMPSGMCNPQAAAIAIGRCRANTS
jgi:hypothetical protein